MTESEFENEQIGPWVRAETEYDFEIEVWLNEVSDKFLIVQKTVEQWRAEPQYEMIITDERFGVRPDFSAESDSREAILDLAHEEMEGDA